MYWYYGRVSTIARKVPSYSWLDHYFVQLLYGNMRFTHWVCFIYVEEMEVGYHNVEGFMKLRTGNKFLSSVIPCDAIGHINAMLLILLK